MGVTLVIIWVLRHGAHQPLSSLHGDEGVPRNTELISYETPGGFFESQKIATEENIGPAGLSTHSTFATVFSTLPQQRRRVAGGTPGKVWQHARALRP